MIKYEKFKIDKLFDIYTGRDIIISDTKKGINPLVSHQHDNNGISKFIEKLDNRILFNHKKTIALADRGVFWATTQKQDFYIGTRVKALIFKDGEKTENVRLFFVTAINKLQAYFEEYLENATDKLPELEVMLPVDKYNNIDYEYMENYITDIKDKYLKVIERDCNNKVNQYLKISDISDYELTKEDMKIISDYDKGIGYTEICAKKIFEVKANPQLNKDSFKFSDEGKYPYFTRTVSNNGILGYVEYLDEEHKIDGNSIAVGMLGMKFFYMKHDFYAGQFTKTIFLKDSELSELIAMYFITFFNKYQEILLASNLVRNFEDIFYKIKIKVPIRNDGKIDYELIEKFEKIQEKKIIRRIIEQKNELLLKTKKIINE